MTRTTMFSLMFLVAAVYVSLASAQTDTVSIGGKTHALQPSVSLFNGKDLAGWTTGKGEPVTKGWKAEEGVLVLKEPKTGDIYTKEHYSDFVLDFEWKNGERCNSGIKYKLFQTKNGGWIGLEYQIQDDHGLKIKPESKEATGGLFDVFAPSEEYNVKPLGEYNVGRIVVCGNQVEHWLNGRKVLPFTIGTDPWTEGKAKSKFKNQAEYGTVTTGPIMLQDHGASVWFRKVELRPIQKTE